MAISRDNDSSASGCYVTHRPAHELMFALLMCRHTRVGASVGSLQRLPNDVWWYIFQLCGFTHAHRSGGIIARLAACYPAGPRIAWFLISFPVDAPLLEWARQLTLIEQDLVSRISPAEMIAHATRQPRDVRPNLGRLTDHFNAISHWVGVHHATLHAPSRDHTCGVSLLR